jgi:hypothetical protein
LGLIVFEANSDIEELFPHCLDLYFTMVCSKYATLQKNPAKKTKTKAKTQIAQGLVWV